VKIDFEIKEKLDRQTLVKYMKELELRYGKFRGFTLKKQLG